MRRRDVGNYIMMTDIAKILGVSQKKVDEIEDRCYDVMAQVCEDGKRDTVARSLKKLCNGDLEAFYTGFVMGRLTQLEADVHESIEEHYGAHTSRLAQARDDIANHPEFG